MDQNDMTSPQARCYKTVTVEEAIDTITEAMQVIDLLIRSLDEAVYPGYASAQIAKLLGKAQ